jgi:hypothetical protein
MGRSGSLNGDDIINILVSKPACAQFIGRKLCRFFAEDDPPPQMVDAVASSLRAHSFEMRPVLREIFSSAEFYSGRVMGSQIKSPVQYLIQTSKLLEAPLPSPIVAQNAMRQMGQILFAPPNVKGWDGGKSWISTSTLFFRYNFANYLINGDAILPPGAVAARSKAAGPAVRMSPNELTEQIKRSPIDLGSIVPDGLRSQPKELVAHLAARFFQAQPSEKEANAFVKYLETRKPDTSDQTMRGLIHLMMSTPQFQLA